MHTPTTLNGHPVIGTGPSRHGTDALTVMVKRTGPMPYVVATWSPNCGTEWTWGHYFDTFAAACEDFTKAVPAEVPA